MFNYYLTIFNQLKVNKLNAIQICRNNDNKNQLLRFEHFLIYQKIFI